MFTALISLLVVGFIAYVGWRITNTPRGYKQPSPAPRPPVIPKPKQAVRTEYVAHTPTGRGYDVTTHVPSGRTNQNIAGTRTMPKPVVPPAPSPARETSSVSSSSSSNSSNSSSDDLLLGMVLGGLLSDSTSSFSDSSSSWGDSSNSSNDSSSSFDFGGGDSGGGGASDSW